MEWKGKPRSSNIEDARGRRPTTRMGRSGRGIGISLLTFIGRKFGIKGILVAILGGLVLWKIGLLNPNMLLGSSTQITSNPPAKTSPEQQELFEFVKTVMARTETVWTAEFSRIGRTYQLPRTQVYTGATSTACGNGNSSMGPFYCPGDEKIYIDLSFYDELARTFQAPGDFAQAYVLAHEVGHHVQHLLGTSAKVSARRGQPDYNQLSVRLELQADYYAGMWAKQSIEYFKIDKEDIMEAMRAANAIGDDAIQKKSQGKIVPHTFTHGTSAQRMRWFKKGLESGKIENGDTFSMPYSQL